MSHIHEKIDFTVHVFIVNRNRVLLGKSIKFKIWLGMGGHVDLGEEPNKAALREVKEETGLDVKLISSKNNDGKLGINNDYNRKELVPPEYLNIHDITDTHNHVDMVYFAISESDQFRSDEEFSEYKWFSKEDIEKSKGEIPDSIYKYSLKALEVAKSQSL